MFNIKIAEYKGYDLAFVLDEGDNFWFVIRHSNSQTNSDSVAFHQFDWQLENNHNGDINAFFDSKILPESSALVVSFFGEDTGQPVNPDNWRDVLEHIIRNGIEFKTDPSRVVRK